MLTLPTDSELVLAAAATYVADGKPFVDDLDSALRVFLTTRHDGLNIIAIEGTHDALGWLLDFLAIRATDQESINHPTLGFLHAGFYLSAQAVMSRLALVAARGPYAICGHSLGAALALLIGALLIDDRLPPVKIGAFAPPRVGGDRFVKAATSVPFCAYIFGNDLVPDIPFTMLPAFPYEQVRLTQVGQPAADRFSCHAIANYVAAVHDGFAPNNEAA